MESLRQETEFVISDITFSKWDENGLIGISCEPFETKYAGQIIYWKLTNTGQIEEFQSVGLSVGGTAISESTSYRNFLLTSHTDPLLRLWSLNDLSNPIKRYSYHNMEVEDIKMSPFDGNEFLSCSKDSSWALWSIADKEQPLFSSANESSYPIMSVHYHSQNPSLLFIAPLDSHIELWHREERRRLFTIMPVEEILFSSMTLNPYNEFLMAMADENGRIFLWDLRRLKREVDSWMSNSLAISQIKFNPHDENLLGCVGTDSYFHLWNIKSKLISSTTLNNSKFYESKQNKEKMKLYEDIGEKQQQQYMGIECLKTFKTHHLPITTFDWSCHDFGLLADASSDYSIFLWNFLEKKYDSLYNSSFSSVSKEEGNYDNEKKIMNSKKDHNVESKL